MRIIELLRREDARIEYRLTRLAASPDTAKAWRAQQLLDLVRQLQAQGDEVEAYGVVWGHTLSLRPSNAALHVSVAVEVDWYDYVPLQNGKPDMHYRLRVRNSQNEPSAEARTRSPVEVERFVRAAFGDVNGPGQRV